MLPTSGGGGGGGGGGGMNPRPPGLRTAHPNEPPGQSAVIRSDTVGRLFDSS